VHPCHSQDSCAAVVQSDLREGIGRSAKAGAPLSRGGSVASCSAYSQRVKRSRRAARLEHSRDFIEKVSLRNVNRDALMG